MITKWLFLVEKRLILRNFLTDNILKQNIETLKLEIDEVEKGGYEHFMLRKYLSNQKTLKML